MRQYMQRVLTARRALNIIRPSRHQCYSTKSQEETHRAKSRVDRLFSRFPRFLHKYIDPLRSAPVSHITSFLILHELTAIVPLVGLAATFHYTNYLPPYVSEGKWVSDGVEKFGGYFRKKGWLGDVGDDGKRTFRDRWWGRGEGGVRIVVEVATAYAITKALLPIRLIISASATPWFARIAVLPITTRFSKIFRFGKKKALPSAAAGTGAVEGGAVAKGTGSKSTNSRPPHDDVGSRLP
ncbi:hypothetical protein L228DRAFT_249983 [Xylona heveae TC161]|uniref:Uncharacterized protein n=1 Tax=Xylona heveae (strain CBS 132557 / TC161) TaxID=1328760 RepID=A0A165ADW5_XYLHT|nr:hypothetical protein L228DRAFT_249983 [Xylona heveae TC161]KZF20316.1 hypothetical protein L228DRAFT_249983 [Xylona heveae TC161]